MILKNQTVELNFNNESFSHLKNVGNIHLSNSIAIKYKCLFIYVANERNFTRNIRNKFKFYKSLNLITQQNQDEFDCDLIFHLFQFRIHFNLRTDYEYEQFYEKCKYSLIRKRNSFNSNQMKCLDESKITNEIINSEKEENNRLINILTDFAFYLIMALILSLLGPVFLMIINHMYLLECQNGSSDINFEAIKASEESKSFSETQCIGLMKLETNKVNEDETKSNTSISIESPICTSGIFQDIQMKTNESNE